MIQASLYAATAPLPHNALTIACFYFSTAVLAKRPVHICPDQGLFGFHSVLSFDV